jgi:hypothetical protein
MCTGDNQVVKTEEDSIVSTKERVRAVLSANMDGPRKVVERYDRS